VPKSLKIFFWGMVISFLGSLPLGTLNVAAMQIGIQESIENAVWFSLGSLVVEMIYVRMSLIGIDWVRKQYKLMRIMEWITLGIIVALAVGSFVAAVKTGAGAMLKMAFLEIGMHGFIRDANVCY
jgi:hypothetical protein